MKCRDVMTLLAQLTDTQISTQIQENDLSVLVSKGYITRISREDHDRAAAEIADLDQMTSDLHLEEEREERDSKTLIHDEKHQYGLRSHFEGRTKKEAEREKVAKEEEVVDEEQADVKLKEAKVTDLIQKKSALDMQVQYGNEYLSLTNLGVSMLHDLNTRNYRVGDMEFSDFMDECKATTDTLQAIAQRARFYADNIKPSIAPSEEDAEEEEERRIRERGLDSQLWAVSIGLAKLDTVNETELSDTKEKFLRTLGSLEVAAGFRSNLDSKVIAAELITLSSMLPTPEQIQSLLSFDEQVRHAKVPEDQSIQIAATLLCMGGSVDEFERLTKKIKSYQAAAMLSTIDLPSEQLHDRFRSFESVFDSWGFSKSEDADLAAAYLSVTKLTPDDIGRDPSTKMLTIIDRLKNDLEFPLLPAAILTSIAALNATEVTDLVEKGAAILHSVAPDLERPELVSLTIRMIYGQ